MPHWEPTEDYAIRFSDETAERRTESQLDEMVHRMNDIASEYGFDLSNWGGWPAMRRVAEGELELWRKYTTHKIVGYKIIRGKGDDVEQEVEEYLSKGYQLNGPLHIVDANGTTIYVQGLVHYE